MSLLSRSWKKVHHGPNKGGYVHKFFVRGQPDLCNKIARRSGSKDLGNANDGPFALAVQDPLVVLQGDRVILPVADSSPPRRQQHNLVPCYGQEAEMDTFMNVFEPPHEKAQQRVRRGHYPNHQASGHWRINTSDLDLRLDDDDLDGFVALLHEGPSCDTAADADAALPHPFKAVVEEENTPSESVQSDSDGSLETDHNFPFKLHLMLESAEKDDYSHIVSWIKEGTAFKVWNNKEFVAKVLPYYFDQSKYESFRRQLNLYGFSRVARGSDRGVISHDFFLRGDRGLCKRIKRKPQPKGGTVKPSPLAPTAGRVPLSESICV
jgi:HSF-type DNA-binding